MRQRISKGLHKTHYVLEREATLAQSCPVFSSGKALDGEEAVCRIQGVADGKSLGPFHGKHCLSRLFSWSHPADHPKDSSRQC